MQNLSDYHKSYTERSDGEIGRRMKVKEIEMKKVLEETGFETGADPIRVAILGSADRRFVKAHKDMFERLLDRPVELTTFDLDASHLEGEENIVEHDVTQPIPGGPFDITLAHVLLKFIETEKQWEVLKNSYDALRSPGIAIHVFGAEELRGEERVEAWNLRDWQYRVPLERWVKQLDQEGIEHEMLEQETIGVESITFVSNILVLKK